MESKRTQWFALAAAAGPARLLHNYRAISGKMRLRGGFKLVHPLEDNILNLNCLLHGDMTGDGWLSAATNALAA